eukprot:scaffold39458_cov34-Cyclotella_meneghiniana.AAC.1
MPVSAQTDEVKGLKWECIARWFVSVVLVTAAEGYVSMFRSLVWCGERQMAEGDRWEWSCDNLLQPRDGKEYSLYRPGLVEKKNCPGVRTSTDGIVIEKRYNEEAGDDEYEYAYKIIPVE